MKNLSVIISSQSPLIEAGMVSMLRSRRESNMIIESIAPHKLEEALEAHMPSILFIDVDIALSLNVFNAVSSKTAIIGLTHSLLSKETKSKFRNLISVYSSMADIEQILENTLIRKNEGPERSELTPREKEILKGVVMGLSNKEIAAKINVSVNTVMTHRRNIASKLQIHSSAGLTIYAIASKLVDIEEVKDAAY